MEPGSRADFRHRSGYVRAAATALMVLATLVGVLRTANAATTVRVLESWPAGEPVELARNQNFYLRLAYETDRPIGIWAAAYRKGQRVNVGSNPSQTYTGSGEALAWFFLMQPGDSVDEVRITAGDGTTSNTPVAAVWRGLVRAGATTDNDEAPPEWVEVMLKQAKRAQDEAYQSRMNQPVSAGETLVFGGFMLAMTALALLGMAWPAWGIWRWRGGWRLAAMVPATMMGFVALRIVLGVAQDPTSHNLWPFELLQAGGLSVVVMALLAMARRLLGARS